MILVLIAAAFFFLGWHAHAWWDTRWLRKLVRDYNMQKIIEDQTGDPPEVKP